MRFSILSRICWRGANRATSKPADPTTAPLGVRSNAAARFPKNELYIHNSLPAIESLADLRNALDFFRARSKDLALLIDGEITV